ncbi:MAG: amidohydrolase family protein [Myxococcota bacterium]
MSSRITRRAVLGATASACVSVGHAAPSRPAAIVGGKALLPGGKVLDPARIDLDREGRISSLKVIPPGTTPGPDEIDARGKTITSGLVEPLCQLGLVEVSLEVSSRDGARRDDDDPIRAAFRSADGYNPASSLIPIARQHGITSAVVVPREGLVSGQSAWVNLGAPSGVEQASLALHAIVDDGAFGHYPGGRASAWLRLRELFVEAAAFAENEGAYLRGQTHDMRTSLLDLRTVARVVRGELPLVLHLDRASDLLIALQWGESVGLVGGSPRARLVFASAAEGWKVAPALARAGVPVLLYPLDDGPRTFTARGARPDNAALLHRAGVRIALSTGESHHARKLRQVAGNAVRAGLPFAAALDAVTEAPARIFGRPDHGGLAVKRRADLVVWSGDPFELSSRAETVLIGGVVQSLRSRQTALFERYR